MSLVQTETDEMGLSRCIKFVVTTKVILEPGHQTVK